MKIEFKNSFRSHIELIPFIQFTDLAIITAGWLFWSVSWQRFTDDKGKVFIYNPTTPLTRNPVIFTTPSVEIHRNFMKTWAFFGVWWYWWKKPYEK